MGPPRRVPAIRSGRTPGRLTHYNPVSGFVSSEAGVRKPPLAVAKSRHARASIAGRPGASRGPPDRPDQTRPAAQAEAGAAAIDSARGPAIRVAVGSERSP